MNPRQQRAETILAWLQGLATLGGALLALAIFARWISPVEVFAALPRWRDATLAALESAATVAAATAAVVVVGLLVLRGGRALLKARAVSWWRYRRRWQAVMARQMLTATKGERVLVPRLRTVHQSAGADALTVTMIDGQTLEDWHRRAPALAAAFGASSGYVRMSRRPDRPGELGLVLLRQHPGALAPKALLAPSPPPQLPARVWSIQFAFALASRPNSGGRTRWMGCWRLQWAWGVLT